MRNSKVILLLIIFVHGADLKPSRRSTLQDIRQSKLGLILHNFVSLHQGPTEVLVDTLKDLIVDSSQELDDLDQDFQIKTYHYMNEVQKHEKDIRLSQLDIAHTQDTIDNLLDPRQRQINKNIDQMKENIGQNGLSLQREFLSIKKLHKTYGARLVENKQAIITVDDALNYIEDIDSPTLIEVSRFRRAIVKISSKQLSAIKEGPIVYALIQLASSSTFDGVMLRQIFNALNEFRSIVVGIQNHMTADDQQNQIDFEDRIKQLDAQQSLYQAQIIDDTYHLSIGKKKIQENIIYIETRQADQNQYQIQLEMTQERYAIETQINSNLRNEYLQDLSVSEYTLSLVKFDQLDGSYD